VIHSDVRSNLEEGGVPGTQDNDGRKVSCRMVAEFL
jgi:hypothetical protein